MREMTTHQREFMAAMLVRNPVVQNPQFETDQNLEVLSIPPPQENNQQGGYVVIEETQRLQPSDIQQKHRSKGSGRLDLGDGEDIQSDEMY